MDRVVTYHEFSFIMWHFVPTAYALYLKGELEGTEAKLGTEPFFYFSPHHEEYNKHNWHMPNFQRYYAHDQVKITEDWVPPPLKYHYKNDLFKFEKPIITIKNKSTIEWNRGLYNYLSKDCLEEIFDTFYDSHQIIYIKPPTKTTRDFVHDHGVSVEDIGDFDLINEKYPEVITMEGLRELAPDRNFNELQMMAMANSNKHIVSAGGEAALGCYFGGDLLIYRHPTAPSHSRGVWHTGSYLRLFSGSNIIGYTSYNDLVSGAKELWLEQ